MIVEHDYRTIQDLLATTNAADLLEGLRRVRQAAGAANADERGRLCEMVAPLFYIDALDHPELLPVVEEAVAVTAGLGEAVIPILLQDMAAGDVKAQMAIAQTLGRMGAQAIDPLIAQYQTGCADPGCRDFLLFALGKVKAPAVLRAAPLAIEAAASPDLELRDTATRAIGKFAENIPAGELPREIRTAFLARLERNLGDASPGVRAKAARSLGKLAKHGHLAPEERAGLKLKLQRALGQDEGYEWDRAYVVRKEAQEALRYLKEG